MAPDTAAQAATLPLLQSAVEPCYSPGQSVASLRFYDNELNAGIARIFRLNPPAGAQATCPGLLGAVSTDDPSGKCNLRPAPPVRFTITTSFASKKPSDFSRGPKTARMTLTQLFSNSALWRVGSASTSV